MGISVEEAALGVIRVINSNMALAIRANSVARGIDPRDFSLMPFGGAGPLHGVALAEEVAAKEVIVPPAPGINAAIGLLVTDMQYEFTRSAPTVLAEANKAAYDTINKYLAQLEQQCRERLTADGIARCQAEVSTHRRMPLSGPGISSCAPTCPTEPLSAANKDIGRRELSRSAQARLWLYLRQRPGRDHDAARGRRSRDRTAAMASPGGGEWRKRRGHFPLFDERRRSTSGGTLDTRRVTIATILKAGHALDGPRCDYPAQLDHPRSARLSRRGQRVW